MLSLALTRYQHSRPDGSECCLEHQLHGFACLIKILSAHFLKQGAVFHRRSILDTVMGIKGQIVAKQAISFFSILQVHVPKTIR